MVVGGGRGGADDDVSASVNMNYAIVWAGMGSFACVRAYVRACVRVFMCVCACVSCAYARRWCPWKVGNMCVRVMASVWTLPVGLEIDCVGACVDTCEQCGERDSIWLDL